MSVEKVKNPKRVAAGKRNYQRKLELQKERQKNPVTVPIRYLSKASEAEEEEMDLDAVEEKLAEQEETIRSLQEEKTEQRLLETFLVSCLSNLAVGGLYVLWEGTKSKIRKNQVFSRFSRKNFFCLSRFDSGWFLFR